MPRKRGIFFARRKRIDAEKTILVFLKQASLRRLYWIQAFLVFKKRNKAA